MIYNHDSNVIAITGESKTSPVIAYGSNGEALILDEEAGVLRPANTHPGFAGIRVIKWPDI